MPTTTTLPFHLSEATPTLTVDVFLTDAGGNALDPTTAYDSYEAAVETSTNRNAPIATSTPSEDGSKVTFVFDQAATDAVEAALLRGSALYLSLAADASDGTLGPRASIPLSRVDGASEAGAAVQRPQVTWTIESDTTVATSVTGPAGADGSVGGTLPWGNLTGTLSDQTDLQTALDAKADLSGGKIPASQIPDIAITEYLGGAADQAAMLALSGEKGDWTVRADTGTVFVITGDDPSVLADWTELGYPTAPVTSVNGQTGVVTLVIPTLPAAASQAEAEAGTETATRLFSPLRVKQAIDALAPSGGGGSDTDARRAALGYGSVSVLTTYDPTTTGDKTGLSLGGLTPFTDDLALTIHYRCSDDNYRAIEIVDSGGTVGLDFDVQFTEHRVRLLIGGTLTTLVSTAWGTGGNPNGGVLRLELYATGRIVAVHSHFDGKINYQMSAAELSDAQAFAWDTWQTNERFADLYVSAVAVQEIAPV